jgi:hypothetical protein
VALQCLQGYPVRWLEGYRGSAEQARAAPFVQHPIQMGAELANQLRVAPFRWMVGALCAFIGALMLVEPHQFGAPVYRAIQPQLQLWGAGFLLAGSALLFVTAVTLGTTVCLAVHALACGVLLLLAGGFASSAAWTGAVAYGVLGLGTALAAILPLLGRRFPWPR